MRRALLVGLLLAVGAGVFVATGVRREREYRRLVAEGEAGLATGQTFVAIEAFSGALALQGDSMLAYLRRGEAYRQRLELDAALRDLLAASRIDPTATRPLEQLGDIHHAMEQYDDAARHYAGYVQLDDRSPRVLYKLALARYRASGARDAIAPLRRALDLDGALAEAHYLLGLCYQAVGQPSEAEESLRRALALEPGLIPAREALAELLHAGGRLDDQITQLEALAALEPERPDRQVGLSLAYAEANRSDLAVLTLGRAAERYPDQPQIYEALGRVWLGMAEARDDRVALGKALEALETATAGTDPTSGALTLQGRALALAGELDAAEAVLTRATEQLPVDRAAHRALAEVAQRLGHPRRARAALIGSEALATAPPTAPARLDAASRIAELSLRLEEPELAEIWFQDLTTRDGDTARWWARLAEARLRSGRTAAAEAAVRAGLLRAPESAALLDLQRQLGSATASR